MSEITKEVYQKIKNEYLQQVKVPQTKPPNSISSALLDSLELAKQQWLNRFQKNYH